MTGLDTNILTRYFGQDDIVQSPKASAVLASLTLEAPGWVSVATLLELVWVMNSRFRPDRSHVTQTLDELLSRQEIQIENEDMVRTALGLFRRGNADFAACLISASARAAGCTTILTFDRDAAKSAGMTLVP